MFKTYKETIQSDFLVTGIFERSYYSFFFKNLYFSMNVLYLSMNIFKMCVFIVIKLSCKEYLNILIIFYLQIKVANILFRLIHRYINFTCFNEIYILQKN